ncbi:DNA starvation/stationary phase protection protein [Maribellus comscasis]|uniref:DNA starvation/stationary phase protection protein n=1 Tax=Maribellus comscasis TaxID=2681766 RepID=A0A6I6JQD5_9BACT|nr:Dps family protein [Maribellus comscasis]QGY43359.1 DNA starvation/stationary phase protection protein [Maribellus comscasis]
MRTNEKIFQNLGFANKDTTELTKEINLLIASYHVHYQKLRNFHWNVTGKDFFDLHEKFEELYNFSKVNIDDLAERVRVFGEKPMARLDEYLKFSKISEPEPGLSPDNMVDSILTDFEILLSQMINVLDLANESGDVSTIDLLNSIVKQTEKYYWMFTAWMEKN